jgi:ubiquinone biosynthesis protein UbiJ
MPARSAALARMTETRPPNPLLVRLARLLEAALNRVLALDEPTRSQLLNLEGQRIGLELRGTGLALEVTVTQGRLVVGPLRELPGDFTVRATPGSLLALALRAGDDSAVAPGKVDISGDAELARRIEKLVRGFRPDVEEAFAQTFGDVLGVPVARALSAALAWSRDSARAVAHDSAEFLRDESRDLIAPAEMDLLLDDIDALRERADRLAARIARVTRAAGGGA